jgi:hypothetical protein
MLKIGYAPYTADFRAPGDRRRFVAYARARQLDFELADPARRYDVIVVTAPRDIVTWSRRASGERVIYDIVDSYLAGEPDAFDLARGVGKYILGDLSRPVRSYRRAIEQMCSRADAVVCGTAEQRAAIAPFCANVHVILDVQDEVVREVKADFGVGEVLNVFWEGLPYTLAQFSTISDVLRRFGRERPLAMHLMTSLSFGRWSGRVGRVQTRRLARRLFERAYLYEWNEQLLSRVATGCDLAVIPLDLDSPFARGKPANKLLSMWRMALPTLASRTPAYGQAMDAAGLDMACSDEREWLEKLRLYAADEAARREAARRGRAFALCEQSDGRILEQWDGVFESIGCAPAARGQVRTVPAIQSNSARRPSSNAVPGA